MLEVYSSVHSYTFPAKSYIPILLKLSLAPVDNKIISLAVFVFSVAVAQGCKEEFLYSAYFKFSFVIFHALL